MTDKNEDTRTPTPKTEFVLHPDLAAWMDRESERIAGLVKDVTDTIPRNWGSAPHPDLPIKATFRPEDIIGEIKPSMLDVAGNMVARFYHHKDRFLGRVDDGMTDAQKATERIWSRRELCNLLSRTTILELLLEHVGAVARGRSTTPLSDKITRIVIDRVRPLSVWVPIEELLVECEFSFGTAVLAPLSPMPEVIAGFAGGEVSSE